MLKTITGIIVVLAIGAGVWWYFGQQSSSLVENTQTQTLGSNSEQTVSATSTASSSVSNREVSVDSSDAALEQDLNNVDAQMSNLNSDNTNADKDLSSKGQ